MFPIDPLPQSGLELGQAIEPIISNHGVLDRITASEATRPKPDQPEIEITYLSTSSKQGV